MLVFGKRDVSLDYRHRKGVYAVCIRNEKVAAIQFPSGMKVLPGGGIEADETDERCLQRELLEELGCRAAMKAFIGSAQTYHINRFNEAVLLEGHFYTADLLKPEQAPTEENHQLVWLPLDQAGELLKLPHQAWAVKQASLALEGE